MRQYNTVRWKYNRGSHPTPGSSAASYHEQAVLNGLYNVIDGNSDCGLPRNFKVDNVFDGDTQLGANITVDSRWRKHFP